MVYVDVAVEKLECVGHVQQRTRNHRGCWKSVEGKYLLKMAGVMLEGESLQIMSWIVSSSVTEMPSEKIKTVSKTWEMPYGPYVITCGQLMMTISTLPTLERLLVWMSDECFRWKGYSHKPPIQTAVANEIKGIFEALTTEDLLASCLHSGMQDQNESFNTLIWQHVTKETHSGLKSVELATFLAVAKFNDGAGSICSVLDHLNIMPGHYYWVVCKKIDGLRVCHSVDYSTEKAKRRRRAIRNRKKGYAEALEENGGP